MTQSGHNFRYVLRLHRIRQIKSTYDVLFVVTALGWLVGIHENNIFRHRLPNCFALQRHNVQRLLQCDVVQLYRDSPGREVRIKYHRYAGKFRDGDGLREPATRVRLKYSRDQRSVVRGPLQGDNELVSGFVKLKVNTMDEAVAWASRYAEAASLRLA